MIYFLCKEMGVKRRKKLPQNESTKPNILSFIAYTLILFFGTTILVNINSNANETYRIDWEERNNKDMRWMFLADNGKEYNLFDPRQKFEHGAAPDYSYLMPMSEEKFSELVEKEKAEKEEKWAIEREERQLKEMEEQLETQTGELVMAPTTVQEEEIIEEQEHGAASEEVIEETSGSLTIKEPKKAYETLWSSLEDRSAFLNTVFEYLVSGKITELPEGAVRYVVLLYGLDEKTQDKAFEERSCMTPWGYEIDHGASVLAYQQRSDALNICNIQRRVCKNGKLSGSYTQAACDEYSNVNPNGSSDGVVRKVSYSTYNSQRLDEFIQPTKETLAPNAEFNYNGKINEPEVPKITWWSEDPLSEEPEGVAQVSDMGKLCKTPWGERVEPGQFVKAYRFQNGFTDIPCQVQIRLCVDGKLEGHYEYPTCQAWETSYEDFLYGYMNNEQPSPQRLLNLLRADLEPDPEYGNNLSSELIDKMLKILKSD